jgi:hypothetical protein
MAERVEVNRWGAMKTNSLPIAPPLSSRKWKRRCGSAPARRMFPVLKLLNASMG